MAEPSTQRAAISLDTGTRQLLCELSDGVLTITLNRPEARNALSSELSPALRRALRDAANDDRVGAVLLTGAGAAFCAGGDVKGMATSRPGAPAMTQGERVVDLQARQRALTGVLATLAKPTIAALPGPAAGAGLAIALACDIRIAADTAFVTTGYLRVALSGDYGISWLLSRAVGPGRARELLLTGERVHAQRAEVLGLVHRVVAASALHTEAFALARELAHGPRDAIRAMKANLDEAQISDLLTSLDGEARRVVACAMTPDHAEAVQAFAQKRAPMFRH